MRIVLIAFLVFTNAWAMDLSFKENAEKNMFSCETDTCFICLGERTEERCRKQPDRGFIDISDEKVVAYGRAGFLVEACEVLAETYFPDQIDIAKLYMLNVEVLNTERKIQFHNISNSSYKMEIYHYLTPDDENKRLVDVMQCHVEPI